MNFFKKRISEQYPPLTVVEDVTVRSKMQHEAFMNAKAESVVGRDTILVQVSSTVYGCISFPFDQYAAVISNHIRC